MLMSRMKSSVIGFPGKTCGKRKIFSTHKAPESIANAGRTGTFAMAAAKKDSRVYWSHSNQTYRETPQERE